METVITLDNEDIQDAIAKKIASLYGINMIGSIIKLMVWSHENNNWEERMIRATIILNHSKDGNIC